MILLDSVYINNSGGKKLLDYLVSVIESKKLDFYYLFDNRCINDYEQISQNKKCFIKACEINRWMFYIKNKHRFSSVFCFGNIPPPIKLNVLVYTYFHNLSLLYQPNNYSIKEKYKKKIKHIYIKTIATNSNYFFVQTNSVKELLLKKIRISYNNCIVFPFWEEYDKIDIYKKDIMNNNGFVYVSNGNTHKNHYKLIEAWTILSQKGYFPTLHLTVTKNYNLLYNYIQEKSKTLKIINHGYVNPIELYSKNRYQIFPSLCESFGLGLIEAAQCGCEIIASDLPYVYDVVKPIEVFNPNDSISIADSIIRVLNKNKQEHISKLIVTNKINEMINFIINHATNNTRS